MWRVLAHNFHFKSAPRDVFNCGVISRTSCQNSLLNTKLHLLRSQETRVQIKNTGFAIGNNRDGWIVSAGEAFHYDVTVTGGRFARSQYGTASRCRGGTCDEREQYQCKKDDSFVHNSCLLQIDFKILSFTKFN